ncbi:MAG: HAD-IIA family hydrolase [Clostridia bacterium]|nr:HAD-IIA family hydrolase [Clostridia bacterium]
MIKREINDDDGLSGIECFLFDMDGTLYLGNDILPGALDLIELLHSQGKKVVYITNNSSRSDADYVKKLNDMGIKSSVDEFFSSADAIAHRLSEMMPGARLYVLGTDSLKDFLAECGFRIVEGYTRDPAEIPDFVVLGFDTSLTYEKLRIFCDYLTDGVRYIATHPDMVCPAEGHRSVPDAGSFMLLIEGATGRRPELIAGKPGPAMINIITEKLGVEKSRTAVVGDRLNTDIMSGINAGTKTVCVLSGETDLAMLRRSDVTPDYVFDSVLEIYESLKHCGK